MEYKVGDSVVIRHMQHGHQFKIGEVVKIFEVDAFTYNAISKSGDTWWVTSNEVSPYHGENNRSAVWCLDEEY